jgi:hypothetical protein
MQAIGASIRKVVDSWYFAGTLTKMIAATTETTTNAIIPICQRVIFGVG